jgi:hypothetical protein
MLAFGSRSTYRSATSPSASAAQQYSEMYEALLAIESLQAPPSRPLAER